MDLQTSHLAAALMSGTASHNNTLQESTAVIPNLKEESKTEKSSGLPKESTEDDKEEMASGEDFSDEVHSFQKLSF